LPEPVVIVEYDPRWPKMYDAEAALIRRAMGDRLVAIEHVGSTAVPGLAAKPIIDIMAGVRALADAEACIGSLEVEGYDYVPQHEGAMPERRYFDRTGASGRTVHLHVVETTSDFWNRHILFRDHLRAHPETAEEYAALKRRLAGIHAAQRDAYTEGKTPFIRSIEERAWRELHPVRRACRKRR